ncbi:MAG TPA: glycosyltransferase family 4 protein [Aquihabitans sp.]|nr:glycosyltransferase family 4 protein [Aquihabitans sp.]
MKVLHVIDGLGLGGGAEHSLVALLPELRERGVTSTVVCLRPRTGGLSDDVRAAGFPLEVLPGQRLPGRVAGLRRAIREHRPDVVHATLFDSCLASRLAGVGLGVPIVNSLVNVRDDAVRVRYLGRTGWKHAVVRLVDGVTARRLLDHAHALTETVRAEAIGVLHLDPGRVTVVPRGRSAATLGAATPERRTRVRARLGVPDAAPVVLSVGRQDRQKGQDVLVRAFADLLAGRPDAVLLIAGRPGTATSAVEQAISETGVSGSVRALGHRTDVADLMAASDVLAFPSYHEGLGCSIVEAMALGLPVVGSDAPAVAEVLEGGRLGELVPRGDVGALSEAREGLLADPDRRRELAGAGRARFEERYELSVVADAMVDLYGEVAAQAAQPADRVAGARAGTT